ncbi:biotin-dependent carboxyltransferase family protein [Marinicellulosiphila megalodicopiae]|uniref:5-oxoprolinase subunit C family protein n=1 Tax=Marinicellulosiphila megalodicopiae TaxID=2724896 RepID=UPI003BB0A854
MKQSLFKVLKPGVLCLIQDSGRFGAFNIGLTNGGPIDKTAFNWANRLCSNDLNAPVIEISIGGLALEAQTNQIIALTGANMPLSINGQSKALWQTHTVQTGDVIKLGYSTKGIRSYLAVQGGFQIEHSFNSASTVCRENIGGLNGTALQTHDELPVLNLDNNIKHKQFLLDKKHQPVYSNDITLRTISSYQHKQFNHIEKQKFYSSEYIVSQHINRMGYRLTGQKIQCNLKGILSEGICHGAAQIPQDGQPIVLLNDRQTIGGYPKIGSVISLDTEKLGQLQAGAKVHFEEISMEEANNIFHLNHNLFLRTLLTLIK